MGLAKICEILYMNILNTEGNKYSGIFSNFRKEIMTSRRSEFRVLFCVRLDAIIDR